jgi:hypothetical protein
MVWEADVIGKEGQNKEEVKGGNLGCGILEGDSGDLTAATVKRTSRQPVIFERVYAESDITKAAKIN